MPSLAALPFFERLGSSRRVLIAGAGGGFDVLAGIPIAEHVRARGDGSQVFFANLSFAYLGGTTAKIIAPHLYEVRATTTGEERYFPELCLARWLASRGMDDAVFAFEKTGVVPLRASYEELARSLALDTIVLVDGGTDILMRGDEAGLGTPEEDMASLAAVAKLPLANKLLASVGFGVDAYHGVCHAHFLENVAALTTNGAYLGAFSLLPTMPEAQAFLAATDFAKANTPLRQSIVNGSIAAAVRGGFGDVPVTDRIAGSELFINPLMSLYFTFDLGGVAAHNLYLPLLEGTQTIFEVGARIEAFRYDTTTRPRRAIPH